MKHFAEMLAACIVVGYLQHRYTPIEIGRLLGRRDKS